ncbi:methionine adenosyltransferase [Humitalea rosea]|uniref:Methionine adenosyltransferase n=1 Tax=Humitalea rosea TaxID=990373 RepID=A0A2W7ILF0_9PROT|nr:methionine adenosyltransferase domain-containing protein [Humitalea rosea]PZW46837.1 methionine adenosyltransferase [Humitalea rosea]
MLGEDLFVSESVTPGHPDKLCDAIADAVVDALLARDAAATAEVECAVASGIVFLAARIASRATVDMPAIAREVLAEVGYGEGHGGFDARRCSILTSLTDAAPAPRDEAEPVADEHVNAFGFACDDTPALMPMPIMLAHRVARAFDAARAAGALGALSPDAKAQVAVRYREGRPEAIASVTLVCGGEAAALAALPGRLGKAVLEPAFVGAPLGFDAGCAVLINPGGVRRGGGPETHPGLTGRKPGIDTYGEFSRQPQAALSGKDLGSIDRLGAYAARWAAKNLVAAGLARRCEVHLCYAAGRAAPASLRVRTEGTGVVPDAELAARLAAVADFRPGPLLRRFWAKPVLFRALAAYGHVGREDLDLPWEATDLAAALRG